MNRLLLTICVLILFVTNIQSQDDSLDTLMDLSLEELLSIKVSVASKSLESFSSAPSIISVISKHEIQNSNARNLTDILNTLPGFNYHTSNLGSTLFQVRGIHSVNDNILLMIDGHPLNDRIFGTIIYILNSIPVDQIEQIEIIRGPGSVLYGTNAFYAVVNIVTLKGGLYNETNINTKLGSDKTLQGIITYKKEDIENNYHLIVSGSVGFSEGPKLDYTDKSNTKDKTSSIQNRYHSYINYKNGNFGFSALYNREELGPYLGIAYYFAPRTLRRYTTIATEANSSFALNKKVTVSHKVYWDSFIYDCDWEYKSAKLNPPNGYLTSAYAKDYKLGTELTIQHSFNDQHRLIFGFVYDYLGITDSEAQDNLPSFGYQFSDIPGSWITNEDETNYAVYVQDNYFITQNLQMVMGIRYDNHTAYGDSWNPRCALTYTLSDNANLKLLYGQAFKAPNFWDLFSNSADQVRNPDLKPEVIKSLEAELNYMFTDNMYTRVNYYHNVIDDLILKTNININGFETSMKKNLGRINVDGLELELRGNFFNDLLAFSFNGFTNRSKDIFNNEDVPWVPNYGLGFTITNKWTDFFKTYINIKHTGQIGREKGDSRSPVDPATVVNLSASVDIDRYTLKASFYNLFNTEVLSPSPYSKLKYDYPHPKINLWFSFGYKL